MLRINFTLQMAQLLPDFLFQFLSTEQVDQDSITCLELEDLRDSLKRVHDPEMEEIKKFLSLENSAEEHECGDECGHDHGHEHKGAPMGVPEPLEAAMAEIDGELEEIDGEYYHKYRPSELKYIFEKIIYYIEKVYKYYMDYAEVNLTLSVGFKFQGELETSMVIEFMRMDLKPENLENVFYLPVKNSMVSDDIAARIYFYYDTEEMEEYVEKFKQITDVLNIKHDDRYNKGLN